MTFHDFDLHIWSEGDHYVAEVTRSPAGISQRERLAWPFQKESDQRLLMGLELAILRSRDSRSGPLLSPEERTLQEFGELVFRKVFCESGSVAAAYTGSLALLHGREDEGLRINLRVDPPEISSLPWEYVFDGRLSKNYLCLRHQSPVVRRLGTVAGAGEIPVRPKVRILAMLVNLPGKWSLPDAENERRVLTELFDKLGMSVELCWTLRATHDSLFEHLQQGPWDIFHFIGHGGVDEAADIDNVLHSEGHVIMDDGRGGADKVPANRLASLLEGARVKLAVFNCCDGARGSASVGAALVAAGVPMAIAMQFAISDVSAARFSQAFYNSLSRGETVERALTVARVFVRLKSDAEWAIPVLFTQANCSALFSPPAASANAHAPKPRPQVEEPAVEDSDRAQAKAEFRKIFWGLT